MEMEGGREPIKNDDKAYTKINRDRLETPQCWSWSQHSTFIKAHLQKLLSAPHTLAADPLISLERWRTTLNLALHMKVDTLVEWETRSAHWVWFLSLKTSSRSLGKRLNTTVPVLQSMKFSSFNPLHGYSQTRQHQLLDTEAHKYDVHEPKKQTRYMYQGIACTCTHIQKYFFGTRRYISGQLLWQEQWYKTNNDVIRPCMGYTLSWAPFDHVEHTFLTLTLWQLQLCLLT